MRSFIKANYEGNDVLVWLPTGYGKNLCYKATSLHKQHTSVVHAHPLHSIYD